MPAEPLSLPFRDKALSKESRTHRGNSLAFKYITIHTTGAFKTLYSKVKLNSETLKRIIYKQGIGSNNYIFSVSRNNVEYF